MIDEFRYRPPLKYLSTGILGILLTVIFFVAMLKVEFWVSIILGILVLFSLAMGIGFLFLFLKNIRARKLIVGLDFIELTSRWNKEVHIKFDSIQEVSEIDSYDTVIEIQTTTGNYLIENQWMKNKDYLSVRERLFNLSSRNQN